MQYITFNYEGGELRIKDFSGDIPEGICVQISTKDIWNNVKKNVIWVSAFFEEDNMTEINLHRNKPRNLAPEEKVFDLGLLLLDFHPHDLPTLSIKDFEEEGF